MGINQTVYPTRKKMSVAVMLMATALVVFVALSVLIVVMGKLPTRPVLTQVGSAQEWRTLRAEQQELLGSYGWIDEENSVVHIPVERAMSLLVERGLPVRPGVESDTMESPTVN